MRAIATAALLTALAATACAGEPPRGLSEKCVECAGGSSGGEWVGVDAACTSWRHYDCEEGLYCNLGWQACLPPSPAGDLCDERIICAEGLICGKGQPRVCEPPVPRGEVCGHLSTCVEGLECNAGGAPGDPRAGTCEPPDGGAGAPCAWWMGRRGQGRGQGCAAGMTCAPASLPDPEGVVFSDEAEHCTALRDRVDVEDQPGCLGFAGTCATSGSLMRGQPCIEDAACANGRCVWVQPPQVVGAMAQMRLVSPWPGVCTGPEDGGSESACLASSGQCDIPCESTDDCLPGLLCWRGGCTARHQVLEGRRCGESDHAEWPPLDAYCALGLTCDIEALECREIGAGGDGDPCEEVADCGARHACAHGVCRPYGMQGAACDAARVCEIGLRCSRSRLVCEVPGSLTVGEACETDESCAAGLFCWDCPNDPNVPEGLCATPQCEPVRGEGQGCLAGACGPGLECRRGPTNQLQCLWPDETGGAR